MKAIDNPGARRQHRRLVRGVRQTSARTRRIRRYHLGHRITGSPAPTYYQQLAGALRRAVSGGQREA